MGEENVRKKRDREYSSELDSDQCESKRVHRPSPESPGFDGEVENYGIINNGIIPEDILDGLDDDGDTMPENQYLDSVIKSFEEEILSPSPSTKAPPPSAELMNLRSDSGEYQLDLGYLLEASDDELGLPPTDSEPQRHPNQDPIDLLSRKSSDSGDLGDMFGFENEIPNYSDFGFDEMGGGAVVDNSDGGFVGAGDGGLFEYSEPSDPSADLSWLCGCT